MCWWCGRWSGRVRCHGITLGGRTGDPGERPALTSLPEPYQKLIAGNGGRVPAFVGPSFVSRWSTRSTMDLIAEFERRFAPPSSQLSQDTRLAMIAYLLQANGAGPGAEPLALISDVPLGEVFPSSARFPLLPR